MDFLSFFQADSPIFIWVVLPLAIFIARIADQSIGTLRLIFVSKGFRILAPVLGFFEVIIWLLAVSQIMQHLDNVMAYIAYGAGFAMGNYIGIRVEEKLSLGKVIIRIIPKMDTSKLIQFLSEQGYGLTTMDAEGAKGKVKVVMSIIDRKNIPEVVEIINRFNPHAFYTIEDVKAVSEGVFKETARKSIFKSFASKIVKYK